MYKISKLKSGVRLALSPIKETSTVTLLVLVRVGSRYENESNLGISHFIEHMMFKGTEKRPTSIDITKEIDGIGAEFNAFTSKEFTGYYIKTSSKHLNSMIEVLSDMLLHSKFDAQEIQKEKGVIIEEINMYEDNPLMLIDDLLERLIFTGDQLGSPVLGNKETVANLNKDRFDSYLNDLYSADNVVIGLSGDFDDSHVAVVEEKFSFISNDKLNKFHPANINQEQPRVLVQHKETEQAHAAIGFPALSYSDPKLYALEVMSTILGGNMSSRLFINVREQKGLCYFIRSSLSVFEDTGSLVIQAGLDKTRIFEAIELIGSELENIKNGISDDELNRAKEYLTGRMSLDLEDSYFLARWYAHQELLLNKTWSPQEEAKRISQVSRQQVEEVAKQIIDFNKSNMVVIGPFKDQSKFEKLLTKK